MKRRLYSLLCGLGCALIQSPLAVAAVAFDIAPGVERDVAAASSPASPAAETRSPRPIVIRGSGEMSTPGTPAPGSDGLCPDGRAAVGDLGIRSLEFEGTMRLRDGGTWLLAFRSEPTVAGVDPSGPAAGKLREGDVIVAIGGKLVTTSGGGELYSEPPIGKPLELTIRRGRDTRTVSILPAAACPDPARGWPFALPLAPAAPDLPAPAGALTPASPGPAAEVPGVSIPPEAPLPPRAPREVEWADQRAAQELELARREQERSLERAARDLAREQRDGRRAAQLAAREVERAQREYELAVTRAWVRSRPNAWTGLGLAAEDVTVREREAAAGSYVAFASPPEIFSVDEESPAARAGLKRGDLVLSVDGVDITTDEGARCLADLRPDQAVEIAVQRAGRRLNLRLVPEAHEPLVPVAEHNVSGPPVYRLRYSGAIGSTRVEVRTRNRTAVGVEEGPDEIVIETGDASVRISTGRDDR